MRPSILTSILLLLAADLTLAATDVTVSVSPESPQRGQSLVLDVEFTGACAYLLPAVLMGSTIRTELVEPPCPLPTVQQSRFSVLDPPPVGQYLVEVVDGASQVLASTTVDVLDPDFSINVVPNALDPENFLEIQATGIGSCIFSNPTVVENGVVTVDLFDGGICDPPPPRGPFDHRESLALSDLSPGAYDVELRFQDLVVARNTFDNVESGPCVADTYSLCLLHDRFQVQATWRTAAGEEGQAVAVSVREDSGLFWFFGPENIELVVKLHNACDSEFHSYWVFAGGLTDVEVDLTVRDVLTDVTRVYHNDQQVQFAPIQDTEGFDTCP
ncbi:MAG: hypothetical protein K8J08_18810 [Thermoanaerobaculia bacterium]|nr:hypothetical protein [Thermoanaerobaculia bacterium]